MLVPIAFEAAFESPVRIGWVVRGVDRLDKYAQVIVALCSYVIALYGSLFACSVLWRLLDS